MMLSGLFIRYLLNSGEVWTGDSTIVDWHDIENNVASEVHVKRFKSKEVGIKKLHAAFGLSLRRRLPKTRRSRTTSNLTSPGGVESSARRGVPFTLDEARSDPLQSARNDSSQQEGGVADFFEAGCDALQAREDSWSMTGRLFYRHRVMPREQVHVPKESSCPIPSNHVDVERQTKTNLANFEKSSVNDLWNMDQNIIFSQQLGVDLRDSAS